jgi:phosphoglycolate phosphatase
MIDDYSVNCIRKTHLYDGIREMLLELCCLKAPVAVFSNKTEPLTLKIIRHLLPDIPFVKISGARPDYPKKPDPSGAFDIAGFMGLDTHHIIYVGDSDIDMITANRAGMTAVGVSWGFRTRSELLANGAHHIAGFPSEIVSFFK